MPVKSKHLIHYVPHGINYETFKPVNTDDKKLLDIKKKILKNRDYEFILFYNSRNVHRKRTSNIILAFRTFCDNITPEQADKCCLLMHTERQLEAGTDLPAVKNGLCNKYNVVFIDEKFTQEDLNLIYNIADVTILISSSEGFGLSTAESIMAGTPIIVNVTGGLQDQIGQTDESGNPIKFSLDFGSNNIGKYKNHGVWAKPIWPATSYIQGSVQTPFLFDDICKWEDVAEAIMYWYLMPAVDRERCGIIGRDWAIGIGGLSHKNLADQFIKAMDFTLENFTPVKSFSLHTIQDLVNTITVFNDSPGFEIPAIDKEKIKKQIENIKI